MFSASVLCSKTGRIPSRNPILKWLDDFNVHGTAVKISVGPGHSIHTSEINERVQNKLRQSSSPSAM
jgi:hypothetical protein